MPQKYEVIRDEYQDMLQDYVIYFTIKFDTISQESLINSIRHSKYYSESNFKNYDFSIDNIDPKLGAIWIKTEKGYHFINSDLQHSFRRPLIQFNIKQTLLSHQIKKIKLTITRTVVVIFLSQFLQFVPAPN